MSLDPTDTSQKNRFNTEPGLPFMGMTSVVTPEGAGSDSTKEDASSSPGDDTDEQLAHAEELEDDALQDIPSEDDLMAVLGGSPEVLTDEEVPGIPDDATAVDLEIPDLDDVLGHGEEEADVVVSIEDIEEPTADTTDAPSTTQTDPDLPVQGMSISPEDQHAIGELVLERLLMEQNIVGAVMARCRDELREAAVAAVPTVDDLAKHFEEGIDLGQLSHNIWEKAGAEVLEAARQEVRKAVNPEAIARMLAQHHADAVRGPAGPRGEQGRTGSTGVISARTMADALELADHDTLGRMRAQLGKHVEYTQTFPRPDHMQRQAAQMSVRSVLLGALFCAGVFGVVFWVMLPSTESTVPTLDAAANQPAAVARVVGDQEVLLCGGFPDYDSCRSHNEPLSSGTDGWKMTCGTCTDVPSD